MSLCSPIVRASHPNHVLTEKQQAVLQFIEEYQLSHGNSPTLREMREHFQVSSDNSILKHLKALQDKGYLEKNNTPRGIKRLNSVAQRLQAAAQVFTVPVLGHIPAGGPTFTEEQVLDHVDFSTRLVKQGERCFALKVHGLSMINAGIFEGDIIVADPALTPKDGDIVVALVDQENTIKRYRQDKGQTFLQAENPDYSQIYPRDSLEIQGVVVALARKY